MEQERERERGANLCALDGFVCSRLDVRRRLRDDRTQRRVEVDERITFAAEIRNVLFEGSALSSGWDEEIERRQGR